MCPFHGTEYTSLHLLAFGLGFSDIARPVAFDESACLGGAADDGGTKENFGQKGFIAVGAFVQ